MAKTKRTPGPWRHGTPIDGTCEKCFIDGSDHRIAEVFCKRELQKSGKINTGEGIRNANAEFIVKACNSYDALVADNERLAEEKGELERVMKHQIETLETYEASFGLHPLSKQVLNGLARAITKKAGA